MTSAGVPQNVVTITYINSHPRRHQSTSDYTKLSASSRFSINFHHWNILTVVYRHPLICNINFTPFGHKILSRNIPKRITWLLFHVQMSPFATVKIYVLKCSTLQLYTCWLNSCRLTVNPLSRLGHVKLVQIASSGYIRFILNRNSQLTMNFRSYNVILIL